jgi:DNA repair exonuclease SbcCD nuclease subunit
MNRISIVADTHFGIHKNSVKFLDSQLKYFHEECFPYLRLNKIDTIVILGDIFDNRQAINTLILKRVYREFFKPLNEFKSVHIILGNHDTYYNTSIDIHSMPFLDEFDNIKLHEDITTIDIFGHSCTFIPWQVDNTYLQNLPSSDYCFGHLDINGFSMYKQKLSDSITDANRFTNNFKHTFSGHFHIRSKREIGDNKITYIGSPYQLTRNDAYEEKGFAIFDLDTQDFEYINNQNSIKFITLNYPESFTEDQIKNNVIDVVVEYNDKYDEALFDQYIQKVNKCEPLFQPNKKIINNFLENNECKLDQLKTYSVEQLIDEYVRTLECENRDEIYSIINSLYTECKESFI